MKKLTLISSIILLIITILISCKKEIIENSIKKNGYNYRTSDETMLEIIAKSKLSETGKTRGNNNDSMYTRNDELVQLGFDEMCRNMDQTYLADEVYPNTDEFLEYHYSNSFDDGYYSSIYIPNFKVADRNQSPIYCSSFGLSSEYGENSICGFFVEENDTTVVLLDYHEVMQSERIVLVYDVVLKVGVSIDVNDTVPEILDSTARVEQTNALRHYFFSRINIKYTYENDNECEVRATYYTAQNGVIYNGIRNAMVKDIPATQINTLHSIWATIYHYHLSSTNLTNNFYSDYDNKFFGATFEQDNLSSYKPIFIYTSWVTGGEITVFGRMKQYNQYYQAFANDLDDLPNTGCAVNLGDNLNWLHRYD